MNSGQGMLLAVLILLAIGSILSTTFFSTVGYHTLSTQKEIDRERAAALADAGINRALYEVGQDSNWSGVAETVLGGGSYEVSVTTVSATEKRVESVGYVPSKTRPKGKRIVRATFVTNSTNSTFIYGAQVGDGGLELESNARVNGSVYSNGSILGDSGARVTGDAWVAASTSPSVNQQWIAYDQDYTFGKEVVGEKRFDVTQSFKPSVSSTINKVSVYIKKVGLPPDMTVRINKDESGNPGDGGGDVLASATLVASAVSSSTYAWLDIYFADSPSVTANTRYWLLLDAGNDAFNYWQWGSDTSNGYASGTGKYSENWSNKPWNSAGRDFDFKIWMGGSATKARDVDVDGEVHANTIQNVAAGGGAFGQVIDGGTYSGNIKTYSMSNCVVSGNMWYTMQSGCTIAGTSNIPYAGESDPAPQSMPISTTTIQTWKDGAAAGGTCGPPQCDGGGNFHPTSSVSIGPKKITGNLVIDNNITVTLTGTVWVVGSIDISNGGGMRCSVSFGEYSCVILTDSWVHLSNNGSFQGSGQAGSYLMFLTTAAGGTHHDAVMDFHNNATGTIAYAPNGTVWLHNNVNVTQLTAKKVHLSQNVRLNYEIGLASTLFTIGPAGGWQIRSGSWHIIE